MKRNAFAGMAVVVLMAISVRADVTYSPTIYNASDSAGNAIVDGTYVLILDLTNNGWLGHPYTAQAPAGADNSGSWLWDPADLVLQKGVIGDSSNSSAYPGDLTDAFVTVPDSTPGFSPTTAHCYVIWSPANKNANAPGIGAQYGVFDVGIASHDGDTLSPVIDGFATPDLAKATFTTLGNHSAWYNSSLACDVNDDGQITPLDALIVINKLNADGSHALRQPGDALPTPGVGKYWDVNNDGSVSPLDALQVIDSINSTSGSSPLTMSMSADGQYSISVVPEPASLLLLFVGGGVLSARRGRRPQAH
jgi:hypothetical protein